AFECGRVNLATKRCVGALAMGLALVASGLIQAGASSPTAPSVVSSSIPNGEILSPGNLTEVVTFDQQMDTSFFGPSSVSLTNTGFGTAYSSALFSWDATGTILTLNYTNLTDGPYTLTLFAAGFKSAAGLNPFANYVVNFGVDSATTTFPRLSPVAPLGSL